VLSLTVTTCGTTRPGEMSRAQTRATQADVRRQDAAAKVDSARSAQATTHSDQLYHRGLAYQDSATYPQPDETPVLPAADSNRVQRFLTDLFK
jgi:hypothetical protein